MTRLVCLLLRWLPKRAIGCVNKKKPKTRRSPLLLSAVGGFTVHEALRDFAMTMLFSLFSWFFSLACALA